MRNDDRPDDLRRRLLAGGAGLAGAPWLAACGGGGGDATAAPPTAAPAPVLAPPPPAPPLPAPAPPPTPPPPAAADTTPPTLVSSTPAAGATGVARAAPLSLTFSEPVTVPAGALVLSGPRGPVGATLAVSGPVATLTPTRPLGFGERHTLALAAGVRDAAGDALAADSLEFTTLPRNGALSLGGIVIDSYVQRRRSGGSFTWNALPAPVDHGFDWLRAAVTTHSFPALRGTSDWAALGWRNECWSCLEVSGALMREAADLGIRLQAVLFLNDHAAHCGQQRRPAAWAGLDDDALAVAVEQHAREVAQYYRSQGLAIEVFELGNEIDAGAFGWLLWDTIPVPAGVDALNDPAWMRTNLWTRIVPLLQAARRIVLSVCPDAKILLHVAGFGYSRDEIAASAFFESMQALGMPFDLAGLSCPYMMYDQGLPQPFFAAPQFLAVLDRIVALGRPIHIVEVGYNAKSEGTAVTTPAYPYTPHCQADFFRDLAQAVRGRVARLIAFYPDWHEGMPAGSPELEGLGLFSAPGVPRPALEVFNAIAEGRLLSP